MTIAREEIFGPVLATLTFQGEEEAVAIGNSTIYGLAAAVWSKDVKKALRTAKALKAGTVWINAYNLYDPGLPVRRLQGVRLRPRARALRARGVHAGQEHLGGSDV